MLYQGIVLVNKNDSIQNIECLDSDETKFQVLDKDQTLQSLDTVQNYLSTLFNRWEISNDEKKKTCVQICTNRQSTCVIENS